MAMSSRAPAIRHVYKIRRGKGQRFFATNPLRGVRVRSEPPGTGRPGTPGRVFRVEWRGERVPVPTPVQEVRALRVDPKGGSTRRAKQPAVQGWATASRPLSAPPPVTPSIPNVSTEITSISAVDLGSASQSGASALSADRRNPTGAVFRVQPDGLWDEMWASREDAAYDIAIEGDGALLLATGTKGKLFRLSGDPVNVVLVTRVPAQQATVLVRSADRTYVARRILAC